MKSYFRANWRTSLAGIIAIGSAIVHYFLPQYTEQWQTVLAVAGGLGLIAAADARSKTPK